MESALYEGSLRHRRIAPVPHAFEYPVTLAWLDLAELDQVFRGRWLWSAKRPAPAWFRRADYLGEASVPLERAVRDHVERELGWRPEGPVRLLTHLRTSDGALLDKIRDQDQKIAGEIEKEIKAAIDGYAKSFA